ncbi:MAG: hypothetical protein AAFX01_13265 [Cyanobacteria bacterium J06638_28]
MFPEDKHLETYLRPNKKPDPSPDPTIIIVRTIGITISLSVALTLFDALFDIDTLFNLDLDTDNSPGIRINPDTVVNGGQPPETNPNGAGDEEVENPPDENIDDDELPPANPNNPIIVAPNNPIVVAPNTRLRIPRYCNRAYAGSANFRSTPSLRPSAIRGLILVGEWISLTGRTAHGDGILWYEAINESNLLLSKEPNAQNQLNAGQLGWIADYFLM